MGSLQRAFTHYVLGKHPVERSIFMPAIDCFLAELAFLLSFRFPFVIVVQGQLALDIIR